MERHTVLSSQRPPPVGLAPTQKHNNTLIRTTWHELCASTETKYAGRHRWHQGGAARMQMHGFEIADHPKKKKMHKLWSNSHAQARNTQATPGNTRTIHTKANVFAFLFFSLKKSSLSRFCAKSSPAATQVMVCLQQVLHLQTHTAPFTMKPQRRDYTE